MTTLAFDVFWRDHGASKGMRDLGNDAGHAHRETQTLSTHVGKLGGALAAMVGIDVFSGFIRDARESAAISRITEARIQSTGGAAHVTAGQVGDLATAISNKTGADDEAVQSGENMLLTFTNIRNEVGAGNDIFNQASSAVTDMAAAMNGGQVTEQGMQTASIQLGKALNDPIAGMSALRKVGVSFTQQQQDQVKAMVKAGDVLGAQKVILNEVGKEFGGTAAAAADPMQRLTVIAGNLGEQIGGALLPAVNDFANFMANTGAPAISSFVSVLTGIPAPVYAVAAGLAGIVGAVKLTTTVTGAYQDVVKVTGTVLEYFAGKNVAAAAAEGVQAGAADVAAVSTGRLGAAAQGAGVMLGGLAAKALLAGGIGGLAYLSAQVSGWQGTAEVTKVKTNDLADALLHMRDNANAPVAALNAATTSGERFWGSVQLGSDVLQQFGGIARGAFGGGMADIIGRAQSGSERMDRFNATAQQLDAALAQMAAGGHAKEAAKILDDIRVKSGLSDDEFVHVTNHLPAYTAAVGGAGAATSTTAGATRDLTTAQQASRAAADAAAAALKDEIDRLTGATDAFLGARSAARGVRDAQDALTAAIKTNGRGLSDNTAKGRANAAALDAVAQATRTDLKAKLDAGMPMARFAAAVANSRGKLIAEAEAAGMTRAAAKRYADQILRVPTKQITNYQALHLNEVIGKVNALHRGINSLSSKDLKIALQSAGDLPTRLQIYAALKGRKDGGKITGPGGPRSDTAGIFALSNGEFVVNATAASRHLGTLEAINAGRMADGGVVGRHVNYTASTRGYWPSAALINSYYGAVEQMIANAVGAKYAASAAAGSSPAAGVAGVARWAPVILNALRLIGQSSSWLNTVEGRMARESGGNPRAINNWDINAQNGDPSRGLMQVIGATFRAYHVPGTSFDIYNPLANIAAGLNYAVHRYGSLMALNRPGGYDAGGLARSAGAMWKGPKPERVLSPRQTDVFERAMARAATGGGRGGSVQIDVHVHGDARGFEDQLVGAVNRVARSGRLDRPLRQIVRA